MSQDDNKKPLNILDTLSQIMKVLKNSISLLQKLFNLCVRQMQISQTKVQIDKLKSILIQISQYNTQYQQNTFKQVFPRLTSRLRQILYVNQNQYTHSSSHRSIKCYIKQAISLVKIFEEDKDLSKLCKKLAYLISKYSVQIPFLLNCKINEKSKIEIANFSEKKQKQTPKKDKTDNQYNLIKILQIINKRYSLLTGMAIDYAHFRTVIFQTKNQQNNIYSDCFERNKLMLNNIQQYSKQHHQYLNRINFTKRKRFLKQNRQLKTQYQKQQRLQGSNFIHKKSINIKSNLCNFILQKDKLKTPLSNNINSQQKIFLETSRRNLTPFKKQKHNSEEKINLWKAKRQNLKSKDALQMTNILMTGNYFDSQSLKKDLATKNNFYRKKLSSIINRGLDYSQNGFAKSQKLKTNLL